MASRIGQQLGNYRLVRLVGQGTFADVYLGEHRYLKSYAALKVLRTSLKGNEVDRFLSEAQTLVRLRHPNVVRVLEFAVDRGTPVLVMDNAPGGSMRKRHPPGSCLSLATTVAYAKQVAAALQYAHNHKLIHRDVKPENILLGADQQILLSDFGLALLNPSLEQLGTQSMAGTLPYMAPEQVRGRPTFASDQYALGVIVYEWLCGKRPFEGNQWEIINKQLSAAPPPLRETFPELPQEVETVVLRALAKDPSQRFASVQAFALALERASQHGEVDLIGEEQTATLKGIPQATPARIPDYTSRNAFLSSSPGDADFVSRLKNDLAKRGVAVLDSRSDGTASTLGPEDTARQGIRAARAIVVVVSPNTPTSRTVKEHLRIAGMYDRRMVFVWTAGDDIAAVLPDAWEKAAVIDLIDARQSRYETALDEIMACLVAEVSTASNPELPLTEVQEGEPRNPYKGLRAFKQGDSADFFGREALIAELAESIRDMRAMRLLTLIGPSGSGKSSVVMAGLLPQLQRGLLPGSKEWVYLEAVVPGEHPLESLALALAPCMPGRSVKSIREALTDDARWGLHLLAASLVKQAGTKVVLVIDQFEELFAGGVSEEERRRLIDLLVNAVTGAQGPVIAILTLRADFYDRPLYYPALARLLQQYLHVVLPMDLQDMRAVIEQPAALPDVRLTFEGNLVGDLLFEAQGQPGALPLLEFTLDQLFQQREGHWLTLSAYEKMGGVKGALARHAEATYDLLPSEEHRRLARALFLRLIDPGVTEQDTARRRAARSELSLPDPEQARIMREVADAFIQARLLTTNTVAGTTTIEVSHEALIREWPRLAHWLREARDDITIQHAISADAADWTRHSKPADRLYRGAQLLEAQEWARRGVPSADELAFLQAGADERRRQEEAELSQKERELTLQRRVVSRQRLLIAALSIFSVAVIVLASLAEISFLQAQNQQKQTQLQSQIASSRAFAAQANYALANNTLDRGLLLSVKANQTYNTFDARDSLLSALEYSPRLLSILQMNSSVTYLAFLPAGQTLVSFTAGGEVTFWNMQTRKGHTIHLDFRGGIGAIPNWALSPDGQMIAGASDRGLWLWDARTGAKIAQLEPASPGHDSLLPDITPLAFSPDGTLLASGRCTQYSAAGHCAQGRLLLSNLSSQPAASRQLASGALLVTHLAFSPDGKTLLSSSRSLAPAGLSGNLQLWNAVSGSLLAPSFAGFAGVILTVAFSPDGKTLAASDESTGIYLWDVASQKALGPPLSAKGVQSLAFSPDGSTLAAGNPDKTLQLWNVATRQPAGTALVGQQDAITGVAYSPNGSTLVSSDGSGAILVWNMAAESAVAPPFIEEALPYSARVFSALYSPNGEIVVTGDSQGRIILTDAASGNLLGVQDATLAPVIQTSGTPGDAPLTIESLAFSPGGRVLAAGRSDGTIFLWNSATRQLITHFQRETGLRNIAYASDGRTLAAGYANGIILLWDAVTGRVLHQLTHHASGGAPISSVAFSPDGKTLASGDNNTVVFWDVATGKQTGQPLVGHRVSVTGVAFRPDGRVLASIDSNSTVMFWDVAAMKALGSGFVNSDPEIAFEIPVQTGLAFSADGTMLAVGGDQSTTVWDVADPTRPERFTHAFRPPMSGFLSPHVRGVDFDPQGQQVLVISDTYTSNYAVTLWNINRSAWQSIACSIANRNFTLDEWKQFVGDAPYQKVCAHLPVDSSVINDQLKQAHADVVSGDTQDARSLYTQAVQESAPLEDVDLLNRICWTGGTEQFAQVVLSTCDRAVALNPYNGEIYDSRAVTRALTGNRRGAIQDLNFFIQWATAEYLTATNVDLQIQARYKHLVAERTAFMQQLQAGKDPYDTKTLVAIRAESGVDD